MPPKLPLPHKRGLFFIFQNCPRGEGNCETTERQKLSRGNLCLAASNPLRGHPGKRGLLEASEWPTLFSRSVENGHPSPRPLKSLPRGPESLSEALRGLWEGGFPRPRGLLKRGVEFRGPYPKGPEIEKIQDRPPGLKFSIEIEIFKRATHQTSIFVGNSEGPGLKISSEIEIFNRD